MNVHWKYIIEGVDGNGKVWAIDGEVYCEFHEAFEKANKECSQILTRGEKFPDCHGPYKIKRMELRE
jgi:hypothetical protein